MPGLQLLGFIPFSEDIIEADLEGRPPFEKDTAGLDVVREMVSKMVMP
jgi:CO dehydrogenase nickel-insertion accessory protein CooC1